MLNGKVILQASDSTLTKELHVQANHQTHILSLSFSLEH